MDVDDAAAAVVESVKAAIPTPATKVNGNKKEAEDEKELAALPEGDIYVSLLVAIWLLDQGEYAKVRLSLRDAAVARRLRGGSTDKRPATCRVRNSSTRFFRQCRLSTVEQWTSFRASCTSTGSDCTNSLAKTRLLSERELICRRCAAP